MDRRAVIVGSIAAGAAVLLPAVALSTPMANISKYFIDVSREWAKELKAHWDIDIHKEAQKFMFEFPDYVHTIVKDREFVDGSGFRRLHMTWRFAPSDRPNTYDMTSNGRVESFAYTEHGPKRIG